MLASDDSLQVVAHESVPMDDVAGIYARESGYLDRFIQVGVAQGRVISVSFPETPADTAESNHELLDRIDEYLHGSEDEFTDVAVALTMATEQRAVLERVRAIPYGTQVSVAQLAKMTAEFDADSPDDLTRIRETLAANPVPLLVPDHRVRDGPSGAPGVVEQRLRAVEGL